ncbi:YihY/virulence factor BrkB family protein [Agromyces sp. LHK192]|uniref:YihY/virulence factor BrkB family protein n=1 Tax=Agromyces sp. LHK192 TaxID=2498704 RepID=UPI001F0C2FD2|nr:YihY/virulence factor BrkB family protein [Agromyces sp. LHK192]
MGDRTPGGGEEARAGAPADDDRETQAERLTSTGQDLRERFDPQIQQVTKLTQRTMALFPVRVWRHFLAQNGFILSSGMSYQSLFAVFAGIYVVFAIAGLWLINSPDLMDAFVRLVNTLAPGLIGPDGVVTEDALTQIAENSTGVVGWTGAIALGSFIWTAIGFVTYARIAVRSMFGLPKDTRSYTLLKARDFVAALAFGLTLFVATVLSIITTSFIDWGLGLLGWDLESRTSTFFVQTGAFIVVFAIDTLALAALFRFLSGAAMPWRRMWAGSLLGSGGLTVIQLFSSVVLAFTSSNPLLTTFAVFIGLLLWFRVTSIVILVAACWVAVEASDRNESLRSVTAEQLEFERRQQEHAALVTAAQVKVRMSREELEGAGWFGRLSARRALDRAEAELAELEASPPEAPPRPQAPWSSAGSRQKDVGPLP